MNNREFVLDAMRRNGKAAALAVQEKASAMTGTELNAQDDYIPTFQAAKAKCNMLERPVGFVCKSSEGRVVKLLQGYDSVTFPEEPEKLPAQWGFVWSTDPAKAKPFVALSTSPYNKGECCLNEAGQAKRSTIDNNVWSPDEAPQYWEDVEVEADG